MEYSLIFYFILLFGSTQCELLGVIQVNRHGARTGKHFKDLTKNLFFGSAETQLTINGLVQQEALGQWVAERYITHDYKFLNKEYKKGEVIFKVSPFERTIFSAANFAKGMFPDSKIVPLFKGNQEAEKRIRTDDAPPIAGFKLRGNITEIELVVEDPDSDNVFHASTCRLDASSNKRIKDLLVKTAIFNYTKEEIKEAVEDVRSQWPEAFVGKSDDEIYSVRFLKRLNAFISPTQYHFNHGYFNLTQKTLTILRKIQVEKWYSRRLTDSPGLKFTTSGLFSEFLHHFHIFQSRSENGKYDDYHSLYHNNHDPLKFVAYSGHDSTIITLLTQLMSRDKLHSMFSNVDSHYSFLQPDFASHFIIELHSGSDGFLSENKLFVRLIYNGEVVKDGFHNDLIYDSNLNGLEYHKFRDFLGKRIDENYMNLYCKRESR